MQLIPVDRVAHHLRQKEESIVYLVKALWNHIAVRQQ